MGNIALAENQISKEDILHVLTELLKEDRIPKQYTNFAISYKGD